MNNDKLIKTEFDGRKAWVVGAPKEKHPYKGAIATCLGAKSTNEGWVMMFKDVKTGDEFPIKGGNEIVWVTNDEKDESKEG